MPFAPTFQRVDVAIQKAVQDAGLIPRRADSLFEGGAVLQKILSGIEESRVVVADLTGRNANVFYELGIAHVRKDATVLLTQDINDVPFDLRHLELLPYSLNRSGMGTLRRQLAPLIKQLATTLDMPHDDDVRVLYWAMSDRNTTGGGLVVENIGTDVVLQIEGQRLMPTGAFEISTALKSLRPGERLGIGSPWTSAPPPPDAPQEVPPSTYVTRVAWHDRTDTRHVGAWTVTEKRDK